MIHCENCRFWVYGYCIGLRRETYDRDGCEAGEKKIIRSTNNAEEGEDILPKRCKKCKQAEVEE